MFYDEIYSDCDLFPPRSWDPRDLNHFITLIVSKDEDACFRSKEATEIVDEAGAVGRLKLGKKRDTNTA